MNAIDLTKRAPLSVPLAGFLALAASACGPSNIASGADAGGAADAGESVDAGSPGCHSQAKGADRPRKVILAHPFDSAGNKAEVYDVLDLSSSGVVTQPATRQTFTMGRALYNPIAFTPDGEIGVSVQEDGSLGIFRIDDAGAVHVIAAKYLEGFYANSVAIDARGERIYVVDQNYPNNGGGIYSVRLGCDDSLVAEGKLFESKLAYTMSLIPARPGEAFLFATALTGAQAGDSHLLNWNTQPPSITATGSVFSDPDAVVSDSRVTDDGHFALIADNNMFSGDRVGVVELTASTVRPVQVLTGLKDVAQVIPSTFDNSALAVCMEGNAIYKLAFDGANAAKPYSDPVLITYSGAKPQLPGASVRIERGALRGRVLVAELAGIRQVQFQAGGTVTDLGLTKFLTGYESITGSLGVQP